MNASFRSRLGVGRLGIGLLSDAATRAALVEPLAAHGVEIDAGPAGPTAEVLSRRRRRLAEHRTQSGLKIVDHGEFRSRARRRVIS